MLAESGGVDPWNNPGFRVRGLGLGFMVGFRVRV